MINRPSLNHVGKKRDEATAHICLDWLITQCKSASDVDKFGVVLRDIAFWAIDPREPRHRIKSLQCGAGGWFPQNDVPGMPADQISVTLTKLEREMLIERQRVSHPYMFRTTELGKKYLKLVEKKHDKQK